MAKPWIKIFSAGKHKDTYGREVEWTRDDLDKIAHNYSEDLATGRPLAPVVLGHPKTTAAPAYGWVAQLKRVGDFLYAQLDKLNKDFVAAVNEGSWQYVSSSFSEDKARFRHLAFLGATPPAIKNIPAVGELAYAEGEQGLDYQFANYRANAIARVLQGLREFLIDKFDVETADRHVSQWDVDSVKHLAEELPDPPQHLDFADPNKETPMSEQDRQELEQLRADRDRLARESAQKDQRIRELAYAQQRVEDQRFIDSLRAVDHTHKTGPRLTAAQATTALDLMSALRGVDSFDFADGEGTAKKAPVEVFRVFLENLPEALSYSEAATQDKAIPADAAELIEQKVAAMRAKNKDLSYAAALAEVQREYPALAKALAESH